VRTPWREFCVLAYCRGAECGFHLKSASERRPLASFGIDPYSSVVRICTQADGAASEHRILEARGQCGGYLSIEYPVSSELIQRAQKQMDSMRYSASEPSASSGDRINVQRIVVAREPRKRHAVIKRDEEFAAECQHMTSLFPDEDTLRF
jgi:hypothetical protein